MKSAETAPTAASAASLRERGRKRIVRIVLLGTGALSLAVGAAGIFIPVLPSTPFLLLSAFCFLKSSVRLHRWLVGHRLFGPFIKNYLKYKAVSPRAKIASLALLWASILCSALFIVTALWLKIGLLIMAAGVTVHILFLKTLTKGMLARPDDVPTPAAEGAAAHIEEGRPSASMTRETRRQADTCQPIDAP